MAHFDRCLVTEETGLQKPFTPEVRDLLVEKRAQANTFKRGLELCVYPRADRRPLLAAGCEELR